MLRDITLDWTVDPATVLLVALAAALYARGTRRLAARGRAWPAGRSVAFASGLAILVVATCSGLASLEDERLSAHALQHALLGMAAPLLLALGAPVTLALQAASRPTQTALLRILHSRPVAVLTHPVVVWVLFGATLVGLYTTPLLEASLRSDLLHAAVHLHVLVVGALFCWTAVGLDPGRWRLPHGARLLFVLVAIPFHAVVGLALVSANDLLAPDWYADIDDQKAGGGVLWGSGELFALVAAGVILAQWMNHEEREARRADEQTLSRTNHSIPGRHGR